MDGRCCGPNSLEKCKKHKVLQVWKPVSAESECMLKTVRSGSTGPIEDHIHCDEKMLNDSFCGLTALISAAADCNIKSEHVEGKETTSCFSKTEDASDINENTGPAECSNMKQQVVNSGIACKTGKHSLSVQVDAPLIRFVKGKWGLTQKQIEEELDVKMIFPSAKDDTCIVIEGAKENVTMASEKITSILEQAVKSPNLDYSHFISLPLAIHSELLEKLHGFQNSILGEVNYMQDGHIEDNYSEDSSADNGDSESKPLGRANIAVKFKVQNSGEHVRLNMDADGTNISKSSTLSVLGIDRSIFIKPKTFHLTVLMLKLWNKDRVALATEILKGVSSKVMDALENRPVSVRLRGLACMRGSPAKAHVLYAPVEEVGEEGRLLRACQVIIDAYVESGLVLQKDARQSLKLHATLMNTRHRKRKKGTKQHDSFDARSIFRSYGSEDWGEYLISEVHLSQRFAFDENGYYRCCGSIPFHGSL